MYIQCSAPRKTNLKRDRQTVRSRVQNPAAAAACGQTDREIQPLIDWASSEYLDGHSRVDGPLEIAVAARHVWSRALYT